MEVGQWDWLREDGRGQETKGKRAKVGLASGAGTSSTNP